jgi:hypothetical protein
MSFRLAFLSSTFLSTLIAGVAVAAEKTPSSRAVDGVNGKFELFGGSYATKGLYAAGGSLAVPLGDRFGAQFDGAAGSFAGRFLGGLGAHVFARNPQQGLLGVYADYTRWSQYGGVHVSRVGGEGEVYLGRWTLYGLAGVEFGNHASASLTSRNSYPSGGVTATVVTTQGALDNKTRFFDRVTLSYYITDNWKASIGHRYLGGRHALALGGEYGGFNQRGVMGALFAEARVGEGAHNYGLWGGMRFYLGQSEKSLMRRNREDDPIGDSTAESLFSIANSLGPSSSSGSCTGGEIFLNGACVAPSDIRLKCDATMLTRLENGIGLYRYRYLDGGDAVYVGVMAQEVVAIRPDAVMVAPDGYYRVDYRALGLELQTWDEWLEGTGAGRPLAA